jgi:hypothetical protein
MKKDIKNAIKKDIGIIILLGLFNNIIKNIINNIGIDAKTEYIKIHLFY